METAVVALGVALVVVLMVSHMYVQSLKKDNERLAEAAEDQLKVIERKRRYTRELERTILEKASPEELAQRLSALFSGQEK